VLGGNPWDDGQQATVTACDETSDDPIMEEQLRPLDAAINRLANALVALDERLAKLDRDLEDWLAPLAHKPKRKKRRK
jgi:hypothetical protein